MIDQNSRNVLQQRQAANVIADGISKLTQAISQGTSVSNVATPRTPASDLASQLQGLSKLIGPGNLTDSLTALVKALDGFKIDEKSLGTLKGLVNDLSIKLRLLAEIEAKLPKNIEMNFPKEFPVKGTVDVGTIKHLPDIKVNNISEVADIVNRALATLQSATVQAIVASKVEPLKEVSIKNDVSVIGINEVVDGLEELKKGFNLLLQKDFGSGLTGEIPKVELTNFRQMIPQPVTNININPLRGVVLATAITVSSTATLLPTTALANRRSLSAYNNSAATTIYIGGAGVTSATGTPVPAGTASPAFDIGPNVAVYGITASGTADTRVLEASSAGEGGAH